MIFTKFKCLSKICIFIAIFTIVVMFNLCLPRILSAAEISTSTVAVNFDYYYSAGVAVQGQVQSTGVASGGVTLEYYKSHANIFTPEEKIYFNAAFGLK